MKKTLFIILIAINFATIGFVINNQKNSSMSLTKAVAEEGDEENWVWKTDGADCKCSDTRDGYIMKCKNDPKNKLNSCSEGSPDYCGIDYPNGNIENCGSVE